MWPFTRKEDWEKTPEELNADVQRIAAAGRTDMHNQLITAETGANLPPDARDLWRSTPPGARADLGMPPGSTVASIPNTPPPGATPTTDTSRPPPDMSNRPGGMVAQLLGNANEMKFSRNDNGQIVQVTKHIHDDHPPSPISAGTNDLQPPPGTTSGPMRIGTPPGSVYDTLLAGGPPGTVKTSLPTGLPPSARNTALNISGPPPNQLASAVQKERQYNADQAARTEIWNKRMEENRVLPGETQEAARRRRTQEKADQLRREQMASGERIAKSQGEALAARYSIPAEASIQRAQIGAEGKTGSATTAAEARKYAADRGVDTAQIRADTSETLLTMSLKNKEDLLKMKAELDKAKNGEYTLSNGKKVMKVGNVVFDTESGNQLYDARSADSYAQLVAAISGTQPAPQAGQSPQPASTSSATAVPGVRNKNNVLQDYSAGKITRQQAEDELRKLNG